MPGSSAHELGISDVELSSTLTLPFFYNSQNPLLITPGFAVHFWSGPPSPNDLPPQTFDAYLDLAWNPRVAVLPDAGAARQLARELASAGLRTEVLAGAGALAEVAAHPEVDAVMAAIVGAAGLVPCLAAARAGKRLLLANKALVVGGGLFMQAAKAALLLPIDSEHSAIFSACPRTAAPGRGVSITSCSLRRAGRFGPAIRRRCAT
jgi:hypothetical protein